MTSRFTSPLRLGAFAGALALAACSKGPPPAALPPAPSAAVSGADVNAVQALLMAGDRKGAEKQLKALLKRAPMSAPLLLLRQSLSGDPKEQLGPTNYPYSVRGGDTIEELAERLLGNRLKAYQLARYNDLDTPVTLHPGQTLRIPGAPPRPKPAPVVERPRATAPAPKPIPAAPRPAPAPAKPAANPAAANRARAAGLAALNRGAPREAVALLQRAHGLDPDNAVILRDLQRAQRIAATVRARK